MRRIPSRPRLWGRLPVGGRSRGGAPCLTTTLLLSLLRQVGGSLRRRFNLTVQDWAVILAGAAPDGQAQLEELLAGLLINFEALTLLHLLG